MAASSILRPSCSTVSRFARLSSTTRSTSSFISSSSSFLPPSRPHPSRSPFLSSRLSTTTSINSYRCTRSCSSSTPSPSTSEPSTSTTAPSEELSSSSSSYLPRPSQIHVLPFSIPPELALKRLAAFSIATSFQPKATLAWILHHFLPSFFPDRTPLVKSQMIYLPAWSVQAKVFTKVTLTNGLGFFDELGKEKKEEEKVDDKGDTIEVEVESEFSFFPGTSSSPLGHLVLQPTLPELPEHLPVFNPSRHLEQYGQPITPLPFDLSPLVVPELVRNAKSLKLEAFKAAKRNYGNFLVVDTEKDVRWEQLDATPLYLPFYLAKYEFEGKEATFLLEATNDDAGRCEVYFPNPSGSDIPPTHSTYPESPYARVLLKPLLHRSYHTKHWDLNPGNIPFVQPSLCDLPDHQEVFRKAIETKVEEGDASQLRPKVELLWQWAVAREVDQWLGGTGAKGVAVREEIRRLSLKGRPEGEKMVGRIVKWEGAVEEEEEEEEEED